MKLRLVSILVTFEVEGKTHKGHIDLVVKANSGWFTAAENTAHTIYSEMPGVTVTDTDVLRSQVID